MKMIYETFVCLKFIDHTYFIILKHFLIYSLIIIEKAIIFGQLSAVLNIGDGKFIKWYFINTCGKNLNIKSLIYLMISHRKYSCKI
jgi:hypothetical protein